MYIKFANTHGEVYDYMGSTVDFECDLGSLNTYADGIIIVDRHSLHESTQLIVENVINTLRYILKNCYSQQTDDIIIYLPRMDANISAQAEIQSAFAKLTNAGDNQITYFNITVVHV